MGVDSNTEGHVETFAGAEGEVAVDGNLWLRCFLQ